MVGKVNQANISMWIFQKELQNFILEKLRFSSSGGTGGLGGSGESSEDEREGRIRVGRDYQAIIQSWAIIGQ